MPSLVSEPLPSVRRARLFAIGGIWIALVLCHALPANAQPVKAQPSSDIDRTTARELGREALIALDRGDYTTADDRATRALSLHSAPTLYLARARARRGLGRLISATEDYRAVLRFPLERAEPVSFGEARVSARAELDRLEPQLPHLMLLAPRPLARVTVNGSEWPAAVIGVSRPLDPGAYEIVATAPKGATHTYHMALNLGQHQRLTLDVESAPAESVTPSAAAAAGGADGADITGARASITAATPPASSARTERSVNRTAFYVLAATTLALAGGAVASGIIAMNRKADFERHNHVEEAMSTKERLHDSAQTWAWVNTGLWAGTLAAAGVTTYVFFTTGDAGADAKRPATALQLVARGQF